MEEEDNRKRVEKQCKGEGQHPFDGPPTSSRSSTSDNDSVNFLLPRFHGSTPKFMFNFSSSAAKHEYWNRIPASYYEYPLNARDHSCAVTARDSLSACSTAPHTKFSATAALLLLAAAAAAAAAAVTPPPPMPVSVPPSLRSSSCPSRPASSFQQPQHSALKRAWPQLSLTFLFQTTLHVQVLRASSLHPAPARAPRFLVSRP